MASYILVNHEPILFFSMNARLTKDFTDCSMALRLVFLAQHQFVDKINVVSCAGTASSAAAGTTVDGPSNPQLLQQLVDASYVPSFAGKLSD